MKWKPGFYINGVWDQYRDFTRRCSPCIPASASMSLAAATCTLGPGN